MLRIDGAKKHYKSPGGVVRAVDGASLDVGAGEFVAIFGPSGSGKTTLLLLIAGLIRPDGGSIKFQDYAIWALTRRQLLWYRREHLGIVFQTFNLIPGLSAFDNVMLPRLLGRFDGDEVKSEAAKLLDMVGLTPRARHRADRLSGGEQQRVAIARALTGAPSLVLADEPTGNLDTHSGNDVLILLRDLCKQTGAAVLLVTHDRDALKYADRYLEMRDGKLNAGHRIRRETADLDKAPA